MWYRILTMTWVGSKQSISITSAPTTVSSMQVYSMSWIPRSPSCKKTRTVASRTLKWLFSLVGSTTRMLRRKTSCAGLWQMANWTLSMEVCRDAFPLSLSLSLSHAQQIFSALIHTPACLSFLFCQRLVYARRSIDTLRSNGGSNHAWASISCKGVRWILSPRWLANRSLRTQFHAGEPSFLGCGF